MNISPCPILILTPQFCYLKERTFCSLSNSGSWLGMIFFWGHTWKLLLAAMKRVREAAKHPPVHRTAPHDKKLSGPSVTRPEISEPGLIYVQCIYAYMHMGRLFWRLHLILRTSVYCSVVCMYHRALAHACVHMCAHTHKTGNNLSPLPTSLHIYLMSFQFHLSELLQMCLLHRGEGTLGVPGTDWQLRLAELCSVVVAMPPHALTKRPVSHWATQPLGGPSPPEPDLCRKLAEEGCAQGPKPWSTHESWLWNPPQMPAENRGFA